MPHSEDRTTPETSVCEFSSRSSGGVASESPPLANAGSPPAPEPDDAIPRSNPWRALRSDIATVRRLWAGRRDNPVSVYNHPFRSHVRMAMFVILQAMIAGGLFLLFRGEILGEETVVNLSIILLLGMPIVAFLGFLLFGFQKRAMAQLEELRLTRLTPGEVAFGALAWPWKTALFFLLIPGLILVIGGASWCKDGFYGFFFSLSIGSILAVSWVLAVVLVSGIWMRYGCGILRILIQGVVPYYAIIGAIFYMALYIVDAFPATFHRNFDEHGIVSTGISFLLLFALGTKGIARRRLRIAGCSLFASVDPEALADADWSFNERLARRESRGFFTEWRSAFSVARRGGGRAVLRAWVVAAAVLLVASAVGAWRSSSLGGGVILGALRGALGWSALFALPTYVVALTLLFRCRGSGSPRLPLVAGSTVRSVIPHAVFPSVVAFVLVGAQVLWLGFGEPESAHSRMRWIEYAGLGGAIALGGFALGCVVALSLLPRGRRLWIGSLWLTMAFALHFFPVVEMVLGYHGRILIHSSSGFLTAWIVPCVMAVLGLFLLFVAPDLPQRLHDREFRGVPRNVVTTEWAARANAAPVSAPGSDTEADG